MTPADYAQVSALGIAPTPNRINTGAAIQILRPVAGTSLPSPETALFLEGLYPLDAAGITRILDQIGTSVYGQILAGSLQVWRQTAKSATQSRPDDEPVWFDAAAQTVRSTGDGRVRGFTMRAAGALLGADLWRRPGRLAGIAFGLSEARLASLGPDMARASLETQQALAYAQFHQGAWRLDVVGGLGWSQASVRRQVSVGTAFANIRSAPDVESADLSIKLSTGLRVGPIRLRPGIFAQSGTSWMGGFSESGATPVALRHHSGKTLRSMVGADVDAQWRLELGHIPFDLALGAAYLGEIYGEGAASRISLSNPYSPPFTVRAQRPDPSFLQVRASVSAEIRENGYAYFAVESSPLSAGSHGYNLSGGVRLHL